MPNPKGNQNVDLLQLPSGEDLRGKSGPSSCTLGSLVEPAERAAQRKIPQKSYTFFIFLEWVKMVTRRIDRQRRG
jgi:hypothetical protein